MEDIDCQSEQLIAPNKLQMFCMHSCSIYVFMCINFKKKAVKNVSVLALSLQSFHTVLVLVCRRSDAVSAFFFLQFFSIFFFPAGSAAGMKAASGSGVAQCFRWPLCFFFFLCFLFFWSIFAPLLKKFCAHMQRPRGRARSKMGKTGRSVFEMVSNQSESPKNRNTNCRWGCINTRLLRTCADDDVRRWVTVFVPCLNLRAANPPLSSLVWLSVTQGRQMIGRCGLLLITTDSAW